MKKGKTGYPKRSGGFAADGYELKDAPAGISDAMNAAHAAGPMPKDFLPSPAELKKASTKVVTTIRLDADVLDYFKSMGKGYQTKINAVLRAYKAAYDR